MKIILVSIGTRGDMDPFIAVGELLLEKGHQVICAFPGQFRDLAVDSGLGFASLGDKYVAMLESDAGKVAMGGGGSGLTRLIANFRLAKHQTEANRELVERQYAVIESERPDRIIYNAQASVPLLWGIRNPGRGILLSAVPYLHWVRGHSHLAFHGNFGPLLNRLTYAVADFGVATTAMISKRWLNLPGNITRSRIRRVMHTVKTVYAISPTLFPRPRDWSERLQVLGYLARKESFDWQPEPELVAFLEKNEQILFITFGSMLNPEPDRKTKMFIEVLERHRIPAVINTAAGGLLKQDHVNPDLIRFVPGVPYDWIFPKVHAVVHHGGSGTTHLALKHGCASMIVPHIIDQFVWNKRVAELWAGPEGPRIGDLKVRTLEPGILELVNNPKYRQQAERIAARMAAEDLRETLYHTIVD